MTNADLWKQYDEYTKALTANCEKLGFAAAAIAWFFKTSAGTFPTAILFAFGFIIFFFAADILQYVFAALFIRFWTRNQEKAKWKANQTIEGEYEKPAWLDYPAFIMWWIKIVSLLVAYVCIGIQVFFHAGSA